MEKQKFSTGIKEILKLTEFSPPKRAFSWSSNSLAISAN